MLGVPYDGSACWRAGAADEAPRRLREVSNTSPAVSEEGDLVDPARFLVRAFASAWDRPFGVVHLDAHPDLFDTYDGSALSNACPMRRALETGRLAPEHLLIAGTRSYNPVELFGSGYRHRYRFGFGSVSVRFRCCSVRLGSAQSSSPSTNHSPRSRSR